MSEQLPQIVAGYVTLAEFDAARAELDDTAEALSAAILELAALRERIEALCCESLVPVWKLTTALQVPDA